MIYDTASNIYPTYNHIRETQSIASHMAFIILVANMWGLVLKEWKGVSKKAFATVITGIIVIILSVIIVDYGN
ncbi:MAG TPA: L-rhamnose/proton symporter RhaT [Mucilaginibacter sp.]